MSWRALFVLALITLAPLASAAQSNVSASSNPERRVALVIGNASYRSAPALATPPNDARVMADALRADGFEIVGGGPLIDADKAAIESAIRAFGRAMHGGAIGLFYYAGHGAQVNGSNYIVPVTANVAGEADIKYELVDVGYVLDEMAVANNRLNILVLDACRNNPFGGSGLRGGASGLAVVTAPSGTLIAYSTAPGSVASDGRGANSPYTQALAAAIRTPGIDVFRTFNNVAIAVEDATRGQQQPWTSASAIKGDFYFASGPSVAPPDATPAAATAATPSPKALELAFWESIENSNDPAEYQAYLRKYPGGEFAQIAQERVDGARPAPVQQQMAALPAPSPPADDRSLLQQEMARGYLGLRFVSAEQKRTLMYSVPQRPNTPNRTLRLRLIAAAAIPGALVRRVDVPSPAAAAGLLPGDVITAADGEPVATPAQLNAHLHAKDAGTMVYLSVARGPQRATLRITLTQTPAYQAALVLGNLYAAGRNLPQSDVQAYRWFDIAAANFPPSEAEMRTAAIKRRNAMAARMSTIEVAEAQRLERSGR